MPTCVTGAVRYKLIILDFDGTLADSGPFMAEALNQAAAHFGFRQVSRDELEVLRGQDNRAILKALDLPLWRLPQIAAYVRRLAHDAPAPPLFAGIGAALQEMHEAGAMLAMVSSNGEALIRRSLGDELSARITHYACDASMFGKAAKFRALLKATRTAPEHAIAVGDETRDIEAARKAGIACAAVGWGYATPDILKAHAPDFLFAAPDELATLLTA